jgi:hypothetical protein
VAAEGVVKSIVLMGYIYGIVVEQVLHLVLSKSFRRVDSLSI